MEQFSSLKLYINGPQNKYNASSTHFSWLLGPEHMCARYPLLVDNCHTSWSQGNLHYIRLHFLKLDREFFCLLPSLARLYSAASSPSSRLRSDGSLAIIHFFCFVFLTAGARTHVRQVPPFDWLTTVTPLGLRGIYITSGCTFWNSIENFSAYCPVLRGSILLPPSHPRVFARMARWQ